MDSDKVLSDTPMFDQIFNKPGWFVKVNHILPTNKLAYNTYTFPTERFNS